MLSLDDDIEAPVQAFEPPLSRRPVASEQPEVIVTDASCALPTAWLRHQQVKVVPYSLNLDGIMMTDTRDDSVCAEFARSDMRDLHRFINTPGGPLVAQGLMGHLLQISNLPLLGLTAIAAHCWGPYAYQDWVRCLQLIQLSYVRSRASAYGARPDLPFHGAWLHPAQLTGTSLAIQVAQLCALREGETDRRGIEMVTRNLYRSTRTVVTLGEGSLSAHRRLWPLSGTSGDIGPRMRRLMRQSAVLLLTEKNFHEVCWTTGHLAARAAQISMVVRNIEAGLTSPIVTVAFAGATDELVGTREFDMLCSACRRHHVDLHLSSMPLLPAIRLGPGALEISFASPRLTI